MERKKVRDALVTAMRITQAHLEEFADGFPGPASEKGCYQVIGNTDWTAGFYIGLLWIFYEESGEEVFREAAERHLASFRERIEQRIWVDHHDMGFIFSLSCVAAYRLTGNEQAKVTALLAANNLKSRFQEKGQFIQAWGEMGNPEEYRLIIDCLLNLPLLYWASEVTGDNSYVRTARKHFETAQEVLVREDYSTYHTYYFDKETGKPAYGATKQGYSHESAWSRGQAWGIYGLALNYPHHFTEKTARQWKGVTDYFLAHLPEDLAAYWDLYFMEGDEPRDSSASAIAVCGMLEAYQQGLCSGEYVWKAEQILESLTDHYLAEESDEGNGLLRHSTYGRLLGEGIDEFCLWGDYFYVEALMRCLHPDWKRYW